MRVGWLLDQGVGFGGAELTQAEFRAAAPEGVEVVDCPTGDVVPGLDAYVIHNCVTYSCEDLALVNAPTFKYWHDVGPHVRPDVREWLNIHALPICCSPVQAKRMGIREPEFVPPPVDLDRFREAAASMNGNRSDRAVSVAAWMNPGKAPHLVAEWAEANGGVDFYGGGPFSPPESRPVAYDHMPSLLAQYRTFVYLPTALEPFGRLVVEAWAAGCEIVTNRLVGARWWIENDPGSLETAAEDFWKLIEGGS